MSDVPFTFGIITYADTGVNDLLKASVESIRKLNMPQYEIIIVGKQSVLSQHPDFQHSDIKLIDFDESQKDKWITKKKNIITDNAKFQNIVYQHDYLVYDVNWYNGFKQFGDNFQICMTKMTNPKANREDSTPGAYVQTSDGEENRFRDLVIDMWAYGRMLTSLGIGETTCMIPYDKYEACLSKFMYISGTYWIAKKSFMQSHRLNESLLWGQGEDVEFSRRVRTKTEFQFNPFSIVKLNKPGARIFSIMTDEEILRFKKAVGIK